MKIEIGKDNLLCLVYGQIEQSKVLLLQEMVVGTIDCNKSSHLAEGWPNLQCHRLVVSTKFTSQELRVVTVAVTVGKEDESLERALETHDGKLSSKLL